GYTSLEGRKLYHACAIRQSANRHKPRRMLDLCRWLVCSNQAPLRPPPLFFCSSSIVPSDIADTLRCCPCRPCSTSSDRCQSTAVVVSQKFRWQFLFG